MIDDYEPKISPDFLLQSLNRRLEIVDQRLAEIEGDIEDRKEIGEKIMRQKQDKKEKYRSCLTNKWKLRKNVEGDDLYERKANMRSKIDDLDQEINREMTKQWKDIQKLTKERRELKEKREELKRRKSAAKKALGEG